MRLILPVFQILFFVIVVDVYVFKAFYIVFGKYFKGRKKFPAVSAYWLIPLFFTLIFIISRFKHTVISDYHSINFLFDIIGLFLLIYVPKIFIFVFHFLEDIIKLFVKIIFKKNNRFKIISKTGMIISLIPFLLIVYGMVYGRYDYTVKYQTLEFDNLPLKFDNFRIVQISDFGIGSLNGNDKELKEIVSIVNSLNPDVIIFTGDLVNHFANEVNGTEQILSKFSARCGKFSILGNHDYGDYSKWKNRPNKLENFKD